MHAHYAVRLDAPIWSALEKQYNLETNEIENLLSKWLLWSLSSCLETSTPHPKSMFVRQSESSSPTGQSHMDLSLQVCLTFASQSRHQGATSSLFMVKHVSSGYKAACWVRPVTLCFLKKYTLMYFSYLLSWFSLCLFFNCSVTRVVYFF